MIDKNQATLDLAMQCINYLCQHHHDLHLPSQEVGEKVLTGQYSFHAFSANMWFELSCQYLRSATMASLSTSFVESLQMLCTSRTIRGSQRGVDVVGQSEKEHKIHEESRNEADFKLLHGTPGIVSITLQGLTISQCILTFHPEVRPRYVRITPTYGPGGSRNSRRTMC